MSSVYDSLNKDDKAAYRGELGEEAQSDVLFKIMGNMMADTQKSIQIHGLRGTQVSGNYPAWVISAGATSVAEEDSATVVICHNGAPALRRLPVSIARRILD